MVERLGPPIRIAATAAPVAVPEGATAQPTSAEQAPKPVIAKGKSHAIDITQVYQHEYQKAFGKQPEQVQDNLIKYWLRHFEEMAADYRLPVEEVIRRAMAAYFRKNPVGSFHPLSFEYFLASGLKSTSRNSRSEWKAFCSDLLKAAEKPSGPTSDRAATLTPVISHENGQVGRD